MQFKDRLRELADLVDSSPTEKLRVHRQEILNRLVKIIRESNGDDKYVYKYTIAYDWPAFCALELTTKEGIPLFLSPWQVEQDTKLDQSDDCLIIAARQIGKTTQAASEYLKRMMRRRNRIVTHFAPTIEQLVVCETLIPFINNSDFIRREYGASTTALSADFDENGSTFQAINLTEDGGKSDKKRGKNGTDIGIDEYQMMSQSTWDSVVQPMLTNQLAGKRRVIKWGTVSTKYRPDFDLVMKRAYEAGPLHFSRVNCWQAVDEGIRSPTEGPGSMRQRFKDLNIRCPFVLETGVCPRYLPHWFEDLKDVAPARQLDKIEQDEFKCNLVCQRSNAYLEEDMGLVGQAEGRFFPDKWLTACSKPYRLYNEKEIIANAGRPRFAAADLGKLQDPTEIVIYEGLQGQNILGQPVTKARVIGWQTVQPFSKSQDKEPSWDRVVAAIQNADIRYTPQVWYIDTTRNEGVVKELCSGPRPLSRSRIFANPAAEKNETRGIWWSGEYKSFMYHNHQQMIADERLEVPSMATEPDFFSRFFEDHRHVQKREDSRAQGYTVFEDTGHLVDAMVMGSLWLSNVGIEAPSLDFAFYDNEFNDVTVDSPVPSAWLDF